MHHESEWGPRPERECGDEVHILGKKIEPVWSFLDGLVLKQALDHGGYVPKRDAKQLGTILVSEAESTYGIDGTERLRQRPHDPEKQKYYYSGKKSAYS
jgi:hypothetical protein